MNIVQKNRFKNVYKKSNAKEQCLIKEEIKKIRENPYIGEQKIGNLKGVYVHKFKIHHQLYLLGYMVSKEAITLLSLGTHENFYKKIIR